MEMSNRPDSVWTSSIFAFGFLFFAMWAGFTLWDPRLWILPLMFLFFGLVFLYLGAYIGFIQSPIGVTFQSDGIMLTYRTRSAEHAKWEDIIWMDSLKGHDKQVRLQTRTHHDLRVCYLTHEIAVRLDSAYYRATGRCLPNQDDSRHGIKVADGTIFTNYPSGIEELPFFMTTTICFILGAVVNAIYGTRYLVIVLILFAIAAFTFTLYWTYILKRRPALVLVQEEHIHFYFRHMQQLNAQKSSIRRIIPRSHADSVLFVMGRNLPIRVGREIALFLKGCM